jgi:hypothetical protein
MRQLNEEELRVLRDFEDHMENVVIPEIARIVRARIILAAANRQRVLF